MFTVAVSFKLKIYSVAMTFVEIKFPEFQQRAQSIENFSGILFYYFFQNSDQNLRFWFRIQNSNILLFLSNK